MTDTEIKEALENLNRKLEIIIQLLSAGKGPEWKTARQTGMSKDQLRYFRQTQPNRVKVAIKGKKSYLYNL